MAAATMTAACTGGSPFSSPASAQPADAAASAGAGAAGPHSQVSAAFPPVFAASLALAPAKTGGSPGERIALLSSQTGQVLRWLTPRQAGAYDAVLSVRDGWVYFLRGVASVSVWRVPLAVGRAQPVRTGATGCADCPDGGYAVSPDGRAVAYVISVDHGDVIEIVARNLATGRQNTIVMATKPSPDANNWPPGISSLAWASDDVHLAVQFALTAAINWVLAFDAFTATTMRDGRTVPSGCPVTDKPVCAEFDPAYLGSGALTYVVQRISDRGRASSSLVAWRAGRRTTLLSLPAGMQPLLYDMTAQGQAIWVSGPAVPTGPQTIWRWDGGAPVRVVVLPPLGGSPYYGVGSIAW